MKKYNYIKSAAAISTMALIPLTGNASVVGQQVIKDLQGAGFNSKAAVWSVTPINNTAQLGIYQVPFFNGSQPLISQVTPSTVPGKDFATQYSALIASANQSVDIASLDAQHGLTLDAIRDGITALDAKQHPVTVRMIFGSIVGVINWSLGGRQMSPAEIIKYVTSGIKNPKNSKLKIYAGYYRVNGIRSWNHAKILAVDSDNTITGGVNFIDSGYADKINPVNDMSVYYPEIGLGLAANKFLDNEWKYLCDNVGKSFYNQRMDNLTYYGWENGITKFNDSRKIQKTKCPRSITSADFDSNHDLEADVTKDYAIITARLGKVASWKQDTSDIAQISLINNANSFVNISQQAVYNNSLSSLDANTPGYLSQQPFPRKVLGALCSAIKRGVKVNLMTSGENGNAGTYPNNGKKLIYPSYGSADKLRNFMVKYGGCNLSDLQNNSKFEIRVNSNKVDPASDISNFKYFANHSKVVMVDSKNQGTGQIDGILAYIGSHNTYDQSHAEYGVIIDSKTFGERFEQQFWAYNWNTAK